MKKFILGAFAAAMLASPLAISTASAAPEPQRHDRYDRRDDHRGPRYDQRRPQYRSWARGQRFDHRYAQNYRVVNDWQRYRGRRLYAPPRGYHWVRSGNDAVLVAIAGGLIGAVVTGAFN